jgi:hypothetical protein
MNNRKNYTNKRVRKIIAHAQSQARQDVATADGAVKAAKALLFQLAESHPELLKIIDSNMIDKKLEIGSSALVITGNNISVTNCEILSSKGLEYGINIIGAQKLVLNNIICRRV